MRLKANRLFLGLVFTSCLAVSLAPWVARASFEITPVIASLTPTGRGAVASFTVQNSSESKVPVQIYIVPREPDLNGKEVYKEVAETDEQFQIYPSQIVLNPKEKRTVRVSWIGAPNPKQELAYRMISEELPFDVDDPNKTYTKVTASVKIATKYIGSVYITPTGAVPNLIIKGEATKEPTPQLALEVENKGTAHHILRTMKVTVAAVGVKKVEILLVADQLGPLFNQNILAGKTRRFVLPWPKNLPLGPVKASLEVPKE